MYKIAYFDKHGTFITMSDTSFTTTTEAKQYMDTHVGDEPCGTNYRAVVPDFNK